MTDEDKEAIVRFEGEGGLVLDVKQQARLQLLATGAEISHIDGKQ